MASSFDLDRTERSGLAGPSDRVRADRIRILFLSSYPAVFMSLAAGTIFALLLWPAADRNAVLAWIAALVLTSFARVGVFLAYRAEAPVGPAVLAWERPYALSLIASSTVWGAGATWVMPGDSLLHQAITLFVLIGLAGGALAAYSAIRWLVIAAIGLVLLPTTAWLLAAGGRTEVLLALGALLFFAAAVRSTRVISTALQHNLELTYALQAAKEHAERLAGTDELTGLANRRAFLDRAGALFEYGRRNALAMSAIMLDLDHFKRVNDSHGHAIGDLALQHVARIVASSLRRSDLCCRWGGEEFVLFLPDTGLDEARVVAEKMRATIEASAIAVPGDNLAITASLGVAEGGIDLEALVGRADAALYRAKHEGRNRVAAGAPGA